jgi:pimeloyl-ACP methyl ester carboxylesterase
MKTDPVSIPMETYALAGNFVMPEGAAPGSKVPGVVIVGGPGPLPLQRYSKEGAKNWPVQWTESLAAAGLAGLCYDQRGSGLSTGLYHDADWEMLYEDAKAAAEMLAAQPEVGKTAALAWGDGCGFALQLAAEGKVDALVLLAPPFHPEEVRYARSIKALADRKGLSDRVVQVRVNQWREGIMQTARQVQEGQTTAVVDMGGTETVTNLVRMLQVMAFDAAPVAAQVMVPVLLLHGEDDTAILPAESEAMAGALGGAAERVVYHGAAHFLYRHAPAFEDAAGWLLRVLG